MFLTIKSSHQIDLQLFYQFLYFFSEFICPHSFLIDLDKGFSPFSPSLRSYPFDYFYSLHSLLLLVISLFILRTLELVSFVYLRYFLSYSYRTSITRSLVLLLSALSLSLDWKQLIDSMIIGYLVKCCVVKILWSFFLFYYWVCVTVNEKDTKYDFNVTKSKCYHIISPWSYSIKTEEETMCCPWVEVTPL